MKEVTMAALLVAAVLFGSEVATADVPTGTDMAECNREAREGVQGRSNSPIAKDEAGAAEARKGHPESSDPQVEGIDAARATDAAYRAAYRVCMRRKGF